MEEIMSKVVNRPFPLSTEGIVELYVRHTVSVVEQVAKIVLATFALIGVLATWGATEGSLFTSGEFMTIASLAAFCVTFSSLMWETIKLISHKHGDITTKAIRLTVSVLMLVPVGILVHHLA